MENKKINKEAYLLVLYLVFIFIISYNITCKQLFFVGSDFYFHQKWAEEIGLKNFFNIPISTYPMWHVFVFLINKITGISFFQSSAIFTSIVNILIYLSIIKLFEVCSVNKKSKVNIYSMSFILIIVMPIYVPSFNRNLYLGQPTPNVWHNPTFIMVKLLSIWTFMQYTKIIESRKTYLLDSKKNKKEMLYFSMLLVFTTFAKTSFIQVFIPTLIIYCIFKIFMKEPFFKRTCLDIAITLIPTTILLFIQIKGLFNTADTGNGIIISFLDVWSKFSPNPFISIILGLLFPAIILIPVLKTKNIYVTTAVSMCIVGIIEFAFLMESGDRAYHGNFGWGMYLGVFFVWVMAMIKFNDIIIENKNKKYILLSSIIICLHIFSGAYYIIQLLTVPNFIF